MAAPANAIWKLEDDSTFAVNCFPARGIASNTHDGAGSWIVAYAHEQHQRFKSAFKFHAAEEKGHQRSINPSDATILDANVKPAYTNSLTGDFLLEHHHVESPLDLCSVNVSDCGLEHALDVSFAAFQNVAYVNAAENLLTVESFVTFPNLRELELPVNAIRGIDLHPGDLPTLQVLDLSYNNISSNDVLLLGCLPKLKVLTLTGNGLTSIHPDICQPFSTKDGEEASRTRFQSLEVLLLDDNHLHDMATFAALAALPGLKELNLDKNGITLVPYLKVIGEKILSEAHSASGPRSSQSKRGSPSRGSTGKSKRGAENVVSGIITPINGILEDDKNLQTQDASATKIVDDTTLSGDLSFDASAVTPPFQQLRLLSLANNRISEEEHLLAVAGWPALQALILHGNPLIKNSKGEPPLLSHYLKKRLGISIIRFMPKTPVSKPVLQMRIQRGHKVSCNMPRNSKQAKTHQLPANETLESLHKSVTSDPLTTLPTDPTQIVPCKGLNTSEEVNHDNIFLTQVADDQAVLEGNPPSQQPVTTEKNEPELPPKIENESKQLHAMFEDAQRDPDIHENLSIQGNVKMLRSILHHPLAVSSTETSTKIRTCKFRYRKENIGRINELRHDVRVVPKPDARIARSVKLQNTLTRIRENPPSAIELPLTEALNNTDDEVLISGAETLLEQIESKYRVVREESLKTSRRAKEALVQTIAEVDTMRKKAGI